jgi:hypothetical protein
MVVGCLGSVTILIFFTHTARGKLANRYLYIGSKILY